MWADMLVDCVDRDLSMSEDDEMEVGASDCEGNSTACRRTSASCNCAEMPGP